VRWLPEELTPLGRDVVEMYPGLQGIGRSLEGLQTTDNLYSRRLTLRQVVEQLDVLTDRVQKMSRLAVERWQPVLDHWHKVILMELLTLSAGPASASENPYQPGNPLQQNRSGLFKGRAELRESVVHALLERNRPTLVLHGPRRMGKTSFLLQLPALPPPQTIPVFIDLQRPTVTQDLTAFFYHLARSIRQDIRPYHIKVELPSRDQFGQQPLQVFEDWLDETLLPLLQERNLLLTFDEFEKLGEALRLGRIEMALLDELRHLIQHQTKLAFLFAGVQTMEELGPNWSSYFINVKSLAIDYFRPEEAQELITAPDPAANFTLTYEPVVVDELMAMTCGHPYLIQLVCSAVVEEANAAGVTLVTEMLLAQAVLRALGQGEPYFRNVWDEMVGPAGQALVRQLAAVEGALAGAGVEPTVLSRMVKQRVLCQRNGGYEIEVPLVRRWVNELAPS
jgi:hypothetical protein